MDHLVNVSKTFGLFNNCPNIHGFFSSTVVSSTEAFLAQAILSMGNPAGRNHMLHVYSKFLNTSYNFRLYDIQLQVRINYGV